MQTKYKNEEVSNLIEITSKEAVEELLTGFIAKDDLEKSYEVNQLKPTKHDGLSVLCIHVIVSREGISYEKMLSELTFWPKE